ncbi:MAG TPA: hypothetical protein VMX58_02445 [Patescibacteria group bacterium]|nr:hypothetical protein [Patescibacteria group bacterium]
MAVGGEHERHGEPFDTIRSSSPLERERVALEIGKLPKLVLIDTDGLLRHEEPDPDISDELSKQIGESGILKNPLIATSDHGAASHILLDGVNRHEALRRLEARFTLIQEVDIDSDGIVLSTWNHAVEDLDMKTAVDDLTARLTMRPFSGRFTESGDFIPPGDEEIAGCIVLPDGSCYGIHAPGGPRQRLEAVTAIADRIGWTSKRDRVSYTNMNDLKKHYPGFSALVCFGQFSKTDIMQLSIEGVRFPCSITRFCVPKRVLSFNLPLSLLQGEGTLEEKRILLQLHVLDKIRNRKIKFYEEPTFYFDD